MAAGMNAGIIILKDGSPCIAFDEPLPHPVKHVQFSEEDSLIKLIYNVKNDKLTNGKESSGKILEYPLDYRFKELIQFTGAVYVALVRKGQVIDMKEVPVVFVETATV